MKFYQLMFSVVSMLGIATTTQANPNFQPDTVIEKPMYVFSAPGFDDNDEMEVFLYGEFSNTCGQVGPIEFEINHEKKVITLENKNYFYKGTACAQVINPYLKPKKLGMLKQGTYEIQIKTEKGKFQTMDTVHISKSLGPDKDDYTYAPVKSVEFEAGATPTITVKGVFPSDCMSMERVEVLQRKDQIIEVLPIVKFDENKSECLSKPTEFTEVADVKKAEKGKVLIHVRTMNGQSLSQVVDFN